jgi:hypothetical protein
MENNKINSIVIEFTAPLSGILSIIPEIVAKFDTDVKSYIINKYRECSTDIQE